MTPDDKKHVSATELFNLYHVLTLILPGRVSKIKIMSKSTRAGA